MAQDTDETPRRDYVLTEDGQILSYELFCDIYKRPVTEAEVYALLARYAFIELRDPLSEAQGTKEPVLYKTQAGWDIYDYQERLVITPGRRRFGSFESRDEDGESGGQSGAFTGQAMQSLVEALMLIVERWRGCVEIASGYYPVMRVLWLLCNRMNIELFGFFPSEADHEAFHRIRMSEEKAAAKKTPAPKDPGLG